MKRACSLIREAPWYRREAFESGLKRVGFKVERSTLERVQEGEVLLIWNRYGTNHAIATAFEQKGGRVFVAENGYIGAGGGTPKFQVHPAGPSSEHYYALAESWHNGRGHWPRGDSSRWERLRVELKPWRSGGEYFLICPNRSFGVGDAIMHPDWATRCAARLQKNSKTPIRIRSHPGNDKPSRALMDDISSAAAVVIWSSSCGVHALVEGIPVRCEAPWWILKDATYDTTVPVAEISLDHPWDRMGATSTRQSGFERLAWAQWTLAEVQSGEPFARLLEMEKVAA